MGFVHQESNSWLWHCPVSVQFCPADVGRGDAPTPTACREACCPLTDFCNAVSSDVPSRQVLSQSRYITICCFTDRHFFFTQLWTFRFGNGMSLRSLAGWATCEIHPCARLPKACWNLGKLVEQPLQMLHNEAMLLHVIALCCFVFSC